MADKYTVLKKYFGYDSFREGQELLIDSILRGQDVLGIMPTGAGKSVCYQVPALMLPGITVVVSPLISLMKDQVQALNQAGVHAAYINSSLSEGQISKALYLASQGRYKIIYVAPERLESGEFMRFALGAHLSMLTVDEAHCISQWGQDFRPSYLKIVQFVRQLPRRPVISAFTATATEAVRDDIVCVLGLSEPQVLTTGFDRKNLYFGVEYPGKKEDYVRDYVKKHSEESGVIYCATRKAVEGVYEMLRKAGVPVARYHAGLDIETRVRSQEDFTYDRSPVMVATNAFGMGIDKSNIRYVIHYNMPQSMENYYQEAGRAGRDGGPAQCILLYSAQDVIVNRYLLESKGQNGEMGEEELRIMRERDEDRLRAMSGYCITKNCLREYILRYFGEYGSGPCGSCSNCHREYEERDVTKEAAKIIGCVQEMRQRYGINVVAGTLAGETRAKLQEYRVSEYRSYGSLKGWLETEIKEIISQMVLDGLLAQTVDKYALLRTTEFSQDVLLGNRKVILKTLKGQGGQGSGSGVKERKSDILNSRGLELFDLLRKLRTEAARSRGIPPYLIFSDKTLQEMCIRVPLSREEMLQIPGIGEYKYGQYGERFLEMVSEFTGGTREKFYFGQGPEEARNREKSGGAKAEFSLTRDQAETFPYQEKCLLPELAAAMSGFRNSARMKKITGAEIFRFLTDQKYVEEKYQEGRWKKLVLEAGTEAGMYCAPRTSRNGVEYEDIYYDEKAQRMIVAHYTEE